MIDPDSIRLLMIDLDNTLCDTLHTLTFRQWAHVADRFDGIGKHDIAEGLRSRSGRTSFVSALAELGLSDQERALAVEYYDDNSIDDLTLFPDAHSLLELDLPKVLLTRGEEELQRRKIEHLGIGRYFEDVIIVDTFASKYDAIVKTIADRRLDPNAVLVIGDRLHEEIADAIKAGAQTVFVRRPDIVSVPIEAKPDLETDSLEKVAQLLSHRTG